MMPTEFFAQRPSINPTVYVYKLVGVKSHAGYVKVGYTERDVDTRIKEQKGYFDLSREERIARNEACLNAIFRSSKGDARVEAAVLKAIRGHGDDND